MSDAHSPPSATGFARLTAFVTSERARLLRFLVVGAFNTGVGYGLFCIALAVLPTTFLALCASTALATSFNFLSTGTLVFGARDARSFLRFLGVYALVFAYNAVGLAGLERIGLDPRLGGLLLLPGAVIGAYLLNRHFVFRRIQ